MTKNRFAFDLLKQKELSNWEYCNLHKRKEVFVNWTKADLLLIKSNIKNWNNKNVLFKSFISLACIAEIELTFLCLRDERSSSVLRMPPPSMMKSRKMLSRIEFTFLSWKRCNIDMRSTTIPSNYKYISTHSFHTENTRIVWNNGIHLCSKTAII